MKDRLAGSLLVASSLVDSPVITRGVCLLVHDEDDAVIGVMLNRPMQAPAGVLDGLLGHGGSPAPPRWGKSAPPPAKKDEGHSRNLPAKSDVPPGDPASHGRPHSLHFGGPLSGPVVAVHAASQMAEMETGEGIYVAAQKDNLQRLISDGTLPYRLIIGHLGWQADQLENEIASGWWHVLPATSEIVFSGDAEMWPRLIRRATANSMASWMGVPDDPRAKELN